MWCCDAYLLQAAGTNLLRMTPRTRLCLGPSSLDEIADHMRKLDWEREQARLLSRQLCRRSLMGR